MSTNKRSQFVDVAFTKKQIVDTENKLVALKNKLHRKRITSNYFLPVGIARKFEVVGEDEQGTFYYEGFVNFLNWHVLTPIAIRTDSSLVRDGGRVQYEKLFERRWVVIPLDELRENVGISNGDVFGRDRTYVTFREAWCDFYTASPVAHAPKDVIKLWRLYRDLVEIHNTYPSLFLEFLEQGLFSADDDIGRKIAIAEDYIVGAELGAEHGAMQKLWRQTDMLSGEYLVALLEKWRQLTADILQAAKHMSDNEELLRSKRRDIEANLGAFNIYDPEEAINKACKHGIMKNE